MNYLKEVIAFQNYARDNGLSAGQRSLWYALMAVNNRCGWKEWFTSPISILSMQSGLSKNGTIKARKALVDKGLIDYRSNNSKAPSYKINSLLSYETTGEIGGADSGTDSGTGSGTDSGTGSGTDSGTSSGTGSGPLYKQNKRKQNKTILYNTRKSKFNNYEDENKTDYAALEEAILDQMLEGYE